TSSEVSPAAGPVTTDAQAVRSPVTRSWNANPLAFSVSSQKRPGPVSATALVSWLVTTPCAIAVPPSGRTRQLTCPESLKPKNAVCPAERSKTCRDVVNSGTWRLTSNGSVTEVLWTTASTSSILRLNAPGAFAVGEISTVYRPS